MLRMICRVCLRRWEHHNVRDRTACPRCGGALASHR